MDGVYRSQVDAAEPQNAAAVGKPLRVRDAATLILLDRSGSDIRVLMGKRHERHAFMPGKFVFPGGRTDPGDGRVAVAEGLDPREYAKLAATYARPSAIRARAIAMSAIRETYEEAGLLIGRNSPFETAKAEWQGFAEHNVHPSLEQLRFVARAITPPGRTRRFDTRFLAAWREAVALELPEGGPTNELQELVWLPIAEAKEADIPNITRTILNDLQQRLAIDPGLEPGGTVPCYRMVRNRFVRSLV